MPACTSPYGWLSARDLAAARAAAMEARSYHYATTLDSRAVYYKSSSYGTTTLTGAVVGVVVCLIGGLALIFCVVMMRRRANHKALPGLVGPAAPYVPPQPYRPPPLQPLAYKPEGGGADAFPPPAYSAAAYQTSWPATLEPAHTRETRTVLPV